MYQEGNYITYSYCLLSSSVNRVCIFFFFEGGGGEGGGPGWWVGGKGGRKFKLRTRVSLPQEL
jgi:hypothetical protein